MTDNPRLIMARALDPEAFEGESGHCMLRREKAFEEVDAHRAALAENNLVIERGWADIEGAPKDGSRLLLARFGWANDATGLEPGSTEWRAAIWDNNRRAYLLWWACIGFWSEKWQNWNDGIEPSGLSEPTHFKRLQVLPAPPEGEG